MDQTARFALPLLAPGQAQKEWFHNEALQRADLLLCPVIEGAAIATPPASPAIGACYLIAGGATGAWAGHDGSLAGFTDGGWRFIVPVEGMRLVERTSGEIVIHRGGVWESGILRAQEVRVGGQKIVGQRQGAIAAPTGGSTNDAQCRTAVVAILAALQAHGLIG